MTLIFQTKEAVKLMKIEFATQLPTHFSIILSQINNTRAGVDIHTRFARALHDYSLTEIKANYKKQKHSHPKPAYYVRIN